ncbi:MAG TPA: IclR family transcriptional regulator C-terminal domain-containing protein [Spirochaetia bacterium]|nr:IclR family transcriptional regulator C-terminal domain-containing protein [Spirochaetia bacterium]
MREPTAAKAVVKTMKILECLSRERSFGITEIARLVSADSGSPRMNKSTVYRFLTSLERLGFVRQDGETGKYSLTLRLFEIGTTALDRLEIWREAEPVLKEVGRLTGETVHLATLDESRLVYIGKIESVKTLRVSMMSRVGRTAPTYCTGLGKTLLAHLPPEQVDEILRKEKMVRLTARTITRRSDLDRELASIRKNGYALDDEEHEIGVRCVAAPVRDNKGIVCAAVSVSVPVIRLTDKEIPRYRRIVTQAADEISKRMGYRKTAPARASGSNGRTPAAYSMKPLTRRF